MVKYFLMMKRCKCYQKENETCQMNASSHSNQCLDVEHPSTVLSTTCTQSILLDYEGRVLVITVGKVC